MTIAQRQLAVAPMMDCTDRHDRYFLRLLSPNALLYTEMVTTGALLYGDRDRFLQFDATEHPIALQLGGADPHDLAQCARIAEDYGYDEVNLNIGCPSNRVQSGQFGACLMANAPLVSECAQAMIASTDLPITIKTRLGIDDYDDYAFIKNFVTTVAESGVQVFIIHARKAWLKGLSPKQNRDIPLLNYDRVLQLKKDFPDLTFVINGGINDLETAQELLRHVDGIMVGRAAYYTPYFLAQLEQQLFQTPVPKRSAIIKQLLPYIEQQVQSGVYLSKITRHILGLFHGCQGAKAWRRHLSEHAILPKANSDVVNHALDYVASF